MCEDVPDYACSDVTHELCKEVPREKCVDVPSKVCKDVARDKCSDRSVEVCRYVPREECTDVTVEPCEDVPRENCSLELPFVCLNSFIIIKSESNIAKIIPPSKLEEMKMDSTCLENYKLRSSSIFQKIEVVIHLPKS